LVVEAWSTFEHDAEITDLPEASQKLGGLDERLGGNATEVEARSAYLALVHERHSQAQLGATEGSGVAPGSRAKHDQIEIVSRQCRQGILLGGKNGRA
jgi:hypothetical protein